LLHVEKIIIFQNQQDIPPKKCGGTYQKNIKNSKILPVVLIGGLYKIHVMCLKLAEIDAKQ